MAGCRGLMVSCQDHFIIHHHRLLPLILSSIAGTILHLTSSIRMEQLDLLPYRFLMLLRRATCYDGYD